METGESVCSSGIVEKLVPANGVRFFVGEQGKISYALEAKPNLNEFDFLNSAILPFVLIVIILAGAGLIFYFKNK